MIYNKEVQEALAAGYSLDEIKSLVVDEYNEAIAAGYDRQEVRAELFNVYGLSAGTTQQDLNDAQYLAALMFQPLEEGTSENEKNANAAKSSIEKVDTFGEALAAGWQNSVVGLALRGEAPSLGLSDDTDFWYKVAATSAQALGDLPTQVVGGLFGGLAGAAGGPVGAAAGAGASAGFVTEYTRNALMDSYTNGSATTWAEFSEKTVNNFIAGGKGAIVGAVAGGTGAAVGPAISSVTAKISSPFLSTAAAETSLLSAELAALTTTMSAMEGRIPTAEDFALAGITLGGFKVAGRYTQPVVDKATYEASRVIDKATNLYIKKFMDEYRLTGRSPEQVGQATIIDPQVKERVAAVNQRITSAEESKYYDVYGVLSEETVRARGLDPAKSYTSDELAKAQEGVTPTPEAFTGQWIYGSKREATRNIKAATPDVYLESLQLPKGAPYIVIRGNRDVTLAKVLREYADTPEGRADLIARDSEFFTSNPDWWQKFKTTADERIVPTARAMFENPTPEFIEFLRTHTWSSDLVKELSGTASWSARLENPAKVKWAGIIKQDMKGSKYYMFSNRTLRPSTKKLTGDAPYDEARARFEEKVSIGENPSKTWSEVLDSLMYHGVDTFTALNKGAKASKKSEAYVDAIVSNGNAGRASFMIDYGTINWNGETVGKSLKDILSQVEAKGGSLDEFSVYLTAKSFKELNDRGISTALDPNDTLSILKGPNASIYEPIAKEFKQFNDQILQYQYEAGLITKARLDKLRRDYKESVPLERLIEAFEPELQAEAIRTAEGIFGAEAPSFKPDPLNKGKIFGAGKGNKLYIDPIESQIKATFLATRLAAQNQAKKTAAETFGVKLTSQSAKSPNMVTLSYMHNGKKISVAVPKEIRAATLTMDSGTFQMYNTAVQSMAKATGVFRVGTTMTPVFGAVNFFRDQLTAWLQTPRGIEYCPFVSAFKGLSEVLKTKTTGRESAYTEWLKDGGSNATLVSLGRDFTQRTIKDIQQVPVQNMLKNPGRHYKDLIGLLSPLQVIKRSYRGLEAFTEYTDIMTRVGVYMEAKKAGYSGKESAYLSRMATVDFARAGATVKGLNSVIAFLNARVQGMARIIETIHTDPMGFFDKAFRGVVIPSLLFSMVNNDYIQSNKNPDDPYYDIAMTLKNAPDWMKQAYWLVPIPAIHSVIRIPKPYELAMGFAAPAESFVDYMYKLGSDNELTFLEQLEENGFLSGVYDTMLPNVIPTPLLAPTEVMTNYSFFTGNNIIPAYLEGTVPALQYKPGTSTTAKWISEQLFKIDPTIGSNAMTRFLSPLGIDHLVRGWSGSIGQSLVATMDRILEASGAYDAPVKPAQRVEDFPFFRTFMVKYPSVNANDINKFNEERTELQNRYNAIMQGMKSADPHAQAIAQTLATSTAYANFTGISKAMSQMAKAAQMINITNDDPESKRLQLENVYIQMIQLATEGRKAVRQVEQEIKNARR